VSTPDPDPPDRAGKAVALLHGRRGVFAGLFIGDGAAGGPAGLPAFATSVIFYVLCIPAAFYMQRKLTFAGQEARRGGFLVYAGMQVASLALVASVTTRFVTQVFVFDTLLFLATAATAALVSYVVSDRFAFQRGA
jgi:putative flippase GtrA